MSNDPMTYHLQNYMEKYGLFPRAFAEFLGISMDMYRKLEKSKTPKTLVSLKKLAHGTYTDPEDLAVILSDYKQVFFDMAHPEFGVVVEKRIINRPLSEIATRLVALTESYWTDSHHDEADLMFGGENELEKLAEIALKKGLLEGKTKVLAFHEWLELEPL